jgi:hypothetical protein
MEQLALFALPVKDGDELEDESQDQQEGDYTDPGDEEDVDVVGPSSSSLQNAPISLGDASSQWSMGRVSLWLANNQFSKDWQETFKALNIHGSDFLEAGRGSGGTGYFGLMHQKIYPYLAKECTKSGTGWDQTRERLEGRRMRRLIRNIVKEMGHNYVQG